MVENDMRRKPGRPRSFDADAVLDEVINVFWELGYEAADTETLSKRTGLTKPSLYNAFARAVEKPIGLIWDWVAWLGTSFNSMVFRSMSI